MQFSTHFNDMSVLSLKSETIDKQQLCAVSSNNNSTVRIVTVRMYNCSYLDYDKSVVTANRLQRQRHSSVTTFSSDQCEVGE